MNRKYDAYPKNVPGPFYVRNGCCTVCLAPFGEAPDLMELDEEGSYSHCFFRKQPENEQELYRAIRALWSADLDCIRYAGEDAQILRRLVEANSGILCDEPIPEDARPLLRNHVSFEVLGSYSNVRSNEPHSSLLLEIATSFRDYVKKGELPNYPYQFTPITEQGDMVVFAYSWAREWHQLSFGMDDSHKNRLLIMHSPTPKAGSTGVSLMLDDWLHSDPRFRAPQWYTADAWQGNTDEWQKTPI